MKEGSFYRRKSRKKASSVWKSIDKESGGIYSKTLENLDEKLSDVLTTRQLEICSLIQHLHTSEEIAVKLCVSLKTIEKHRKNVRSTLGLEKDALPKYLRRL